MKHIKTFENLTTSNRGKLYTELVRTLKDQYNNSTPEVKAKFDELSNIFYKNLDSETQKSITRKISKYKTLDELIADVENTLLPPKQGIIAEIFDDYEEWMEFVNNNTWIKKYSILEALYNETIFKMYQNHVGGPFHFVYKDGQIYTGFIKGEKGECRDGNNKPISVEDVLKYF